jgi:hypothetical protein
VQKENNYMVRDSIVISALAAALLIVAPFKGNAQIHEELDDFTVDHFTTAEQVYTFINPGVLADASEFNPAAYACANIYVYANQDIVACGSCFVSPNGSREVSLHSDLISHPVTGVTPTAGVIKVVYTQLHNFACDPLDIATSGEFLKTFRSRGGGDEIELDEVFLSAAERAKLIFDCTAVIDVRSGFTNIGCGVSDPKKAPVHNFTKRKGG